MQIQQQHIGWRLWALWTTATITGSVLAFPLGWELELSFSTPSELGILRYLYTTVGIFVGMAQWLVLRLYLPRSGWWPVATGAALLTSIMLVGPLQCLVLHRHLRKAGWWALTSTLVWFFAMAIGVRVVLTLPYLVSHLGWAWSMMSLHALSGFIAGTLVGALTGLHLVKLLRRPISVS
jgi:hypothetical protein